MGGRNSPRKENSNIIHIYILTIIQTHYLHIRIPIVVVKQACTTPNNFNDLNLAAFNVPCTLE